MSSGPLMYLPLTSIYTVESSITLTDADMEAVGTAAYTPSVANLTKDTTFPHSGLQCLRATSTAGTGQCGAVASGLITGAKYRAVHYVRSVDGVRIPLTTNSAGVVLWTGTTAQTWQLADYVWTTAATYWGPLIFVKSDANQICECDDITLYGLKNVTANKGSLSGYVQLGDGLTPAKLATQVYPRGLTNSSDFRYIQSTIPALGSDGTLFCQWNLGTQFALQSSAMQIGQGATWLTNGAIMYFQHNINQIDGYWGGANPRLSATVLYRGIHTCALSCIGGQLSMYWDGRLVAGPSAIVSPISKTDFSCMGDPGGNYNSTAGKLLCAAVYPYGLTTTQVRALHDRVMSF